MRRPIQETTPPQAAPGALSVVVFAEFLRRRARVICFLFLSLLAAAAAHVLTRPPRYEAQMKLLLKRARSEAPIDTERRQTGAASSELSESEIESEIELFRNRDSLAAVAAEAGLADEIKGAADPAGRLALAVRELNRRLAVYRIEKTNFIAVSLRDRDPGRAARLLQRLAEIYLAKHAVLHRNQDSSQFFARQAEIYAGKLDEAQRQLAEFRRRHQVSLLAAEKEAALRRQDELERALQQTESEIESARDRAAQLRRQISELPETVETQSRTARSEALLERLKARLLELENKRTELVTRYDPGYRLVREVDQQIEETRRMLDEEQQARVVDRTRTLNPIRQSLKADLLRTETDLAGLMAKRDRIDRDLQQVRAGLLELERITGEHDDLARQVKLAEENFLLYQRKREESRLADAMDRERILNVTIVEQPVPPAMPVDQHRAALMLLSAVMAAFASLGAAWLIDSAGPLLRGAAPEAAQANLQAASQAVTAEREELCAEEVGEPPEEVEPEPDEPITAEADGLPAEADAAPAAARAPGVLERIGRQVASRDEYGPMIEFLASNHEPGNGLVLGLPPQIDPEEAALAAVQLAAALHRRNGLPVLLVDAGGARTPLAGYFGLPDAPGLQELLAGEPGTERRMIRRTAFENLWLLPFGRRPRLEPPNGAAAASLHRALSTRSLNVIVYLPRAPEDSYWHVFYSALDAVLTSLAAEGAQSADTDELVWRVVEAKRNYSERRLTLVGSAKQWNSGSQESLLVC